MKRSLLILLSIAGGFIVFSAFFYISKLSQPVTNPPSASFSDETAERLSIHVKDAKQFINTEGFSNSVCMFIDMNIESGKNRFFVYDLSKDSVLNAGLVTHGRCNESWLIGRRYGNQVGCGCTSLGKYKIGHAYKGRFGLAYKLVGLDSTNNNAFRRFVVLHSHECVPNEEVHPYPICQSDGCPTVSQTFLKTLAGIIDASSQPILLWIYD
jgi:hypothetical protein